MKHIEIKKILVIMAIMLLAGGINMVYSTQLYDINVQKTDGSEIKLESYKGKVLLIVNTASKCGFTKQYDDLQALYDRFGKDGFVVLGFPANNFMNQEPGSDEEIQNFCRLNFGVSFPVFAKISVRGKKIHPLYKYLTEKSSNPKHSGKISWNFNKFLIGRNGEILDRYSSATNPQDKDVIAAIEKALK
ncbi:MAG: glutathione peroxidase [Candidatus Cloacimonetes bacterium HGW-Cloacimonetes-3]|nr:MAG: glutathione peroxidase [Candidatus Cloacimonetes bacterium HGW-Cloacimonetes-3]